MANENHAERDAAMLKYLKEKATAVDDQIYALLENMLEQDELDKLLGNRSDYDYDIEAIRKGLVDPIRYMLRLGGKRWRPILMLETIAALGGNPDNYIEFAVIPELVHNGTLVHDDIEDGSLTRRGVDAIHVRFGDDVAVNLGDLMYYLPILTVHGSKKLDDNTKLRLFYIYQREMCRVGLGQGLDITWHKHLVDPRNVTERQYLQMVYSKSGVLARMSMMLGGVLGGADENTVELLGRFGATLGVAFQLHDDILNITPSSVADSKGGVGDDISEGKITLLVVYTIEHSSPKDRKRLMEILKMHTKDQYLIREAISIIERYGAIDYCKRLEGELVENAWGNLSKVLLDSAGKARLRDISNFLISRSI